MRMSFSLHHHGPSSSAFFPSLPFPSLSALSFFPHASKSVLPILSSMAARDMVIDFGKFKGSKMGTLPSTYLRWLTRELPQGRFHVWAEYAEEVLRDPYYRDRMEWEAIEKLFVKGDGKRAKPPFGDASALGSMEALGWNLQDKVGWRLVNFSNLGTTSGGRIPRKEVNASTISAKKRATRKSVKGATSVQDSESLSLREELERRRQQKKELTFPLLRIRPKTIATDIFPGRDGMLRKANEHSEQ